MLPEKSVITQGQTQKHFKICWWNRDVNIDVSRKRDLFTIWRHSQKVENRKKYCEAKKDHERILLMVMDGAAIGVVGKLFGL